jgi:hypothetical protein
MLAKGGAVLAALLVTALAPPSALATTFVSRVNDNLFITNDDGDSQIQVTYDESDFLISGSDLSPGTGCAGSATFVFCDKGPIAKVTLSMGGGNDQWTGGTGGYPVAADGGAGNDRIPGSGAADLIYGGAGDDVIVPNSGDDVVFGQDGVDTVDYSNFSDYPNDPAFARISLDDQANDATRSTTGANIHSDVENLVGTIGADRLVGGAGVNHLTGGAGDDTLIAEDSSADALDCGDGADTAQIDKLDTVTGCETLQGSGAPTTTPATTSDPAPGPGGSDPSSGGPAATASPPSLAVVAAAVSSKFQAALRTVVLKLVVKNAPAPASIRVVCSGKKKGCPFKTKTVGPKSADTVLTKLFKNARLRPGAVIEVRVTRPGMVGKIFRFTIRKKKAPASQTLCLAPGAKTPAACA